MLKEIFKTKRQRRIDENLRQLNLQVKELKGNNEALKRAYDSNNSKLNQLESDNSILKSHIKLINKDFIVGADLGMGKDQSVIIVFKKGRYKEDNIIKSYIFRPDVPVDEIYRMLEAFNEDNVRLDKVHMFPNPKFIK